MITHSAPHSCSFFEYTTPIAWSGSWNSMMCWPRWCEVPVNWLRNVSSTQAFRWARPLRSRLTRMSGANRLTCASRSRMSSDSEYLPASCRISSIDSRRSRRARSWASFMTSIERSGGDQRSRLPAVDRQGGAIHVRSLVRGQEQDGVGDLFRPAHATHRDQLLGVAAVLFAAEHRGHRRRLDRTGDHDVAADIAGAAFGRDRAREIDEGGLGRAVPGHVCGAEQTANRRDVHDRSAGRLLVHQLQSGPHAPEGAVDRGREVRTPGFRRGAIDRPDRIRHRVVDQDVEASMALRHIVDRCDVLLLVADVDLDRLGDAPRRADGAGDLIQHFFPATADDHRGAFLGEASRRRGAYAGAAASDECNLACQTTRHAESPT